MADPTSPAPAAEKPAAAKRASAGFIDQTLEDDIELAYDCFREAARPEVAAALLIRSWTAADQTQLGLHLETADAFIQKIAQAREGTGVGSEAEKTAHTNLLLALDPILKGVRRTHPPRSAERAAYGIGKGVSGASTQDLLRHATFAAGQLAGATPADVLRGVLASEVTHLADLAALYKDADWAHGKAQQDATELLAQLRQHVREVLNKARRDLQGAGDQAFTHREKTNAAQRGAFGLEATAPLRD
jgi:hypothetical protein